MRSVLSWRRYVCFSLPGECLQISSTQTCINLHWYLFVWCNSVLHLCLASVCSNLFDVFELLVLVVLLLGNLLFVKWDGTKQDHEIEDKLQKIVHRMKSSSSNISEFYQVLSRCLFVVAILFRSVQRKRMGSNQLHQSALPMLCKCQSPVDASRWAACQPSGSTACPRWRHRAETGSESTCHVSSAPRGCHCNVLCLKVRCLKDT